MLKDLEQKSLLKGKDVAENFAQWFDELYLGKYDVIPFFKINKLENSDDFENGVNTGANWPLYMGDSTKIELTAGQILQIVFGPLRINTFAIQWQ